jgi:hypothetical protein
MRRVLWIGGFIAAFGSALASAADGVSLYLEMDGSLSENRNQFTLSVDGDGTWALDLNDYWATQAREHLRKRPGAKFRVNGAVGVRTAGNVIQLRDRTLHVSALSPGTPAIKVKTVFPGSPAENRLAINDIIIEVQEKEVTTYDAMVQYLAAHRGESIKMVVVRDGRTVVVDKLTLRTNGPALGITGETVWQWPIGGGLAPTNPGPAEVAPNKG